MTFRFQNVSNLNSLSEIDFVEDNVNPLQDDKMASFSQPINHPPNQDTSLIEYQSSGR